MSTAVPDFFVTGGNLRPDAPSYVVRQADEALYTALQRGEFCYVLDASQMGKSSLMVHTAARLRADGITVALFQLDDIGENLTVEQWYLGQLSRIGEALHLEDPLEDFWLEHPHLGPLQRWTAALRDVVLARCAGPVVLCIDEINYVRRLPFTTDEFFAAIRECYNRRAEEPAFARLTFCLLGTATPTELIQDVRTTPFNIGRRIALTDFSAAEAAPLSRGLGRDDGLGRVLLRRILYWTDGHPYLTQRLCQAVAEDTTITRPAGVDRLCQRLFLSDQARGEDSNLRAVNDRLLQSEAERADLLDLYARVRRRQRLRDDDANPVIGLLRLAGITRVVEGDLRVRNRIYVRVFDRVWIRTHMPDAELRRQRAARRQGALLVGSIALVVLAVVTGLALYAQQQAQHAEQQAEVARQQTSIAQEQTRRAEQQTQVAQEQTRRAEQHFQQAVDAANTMALNVVQGLQPVMGTGSPTLVSIVQSAEEVLDRLLAIAGDNPAALAGKMRMLLVYSDISLQVGNTSQALTRAQEARAIGERLAAQDATNSQWRYDLAFSHERIGNVLVMLDKTTEGVESLHTALRLYETLAQQFPTIVAFARAPFVVHTRLGRLAQQQSDFVAVLQAYDSALGYIERLAQRHPHHIPWQHEHAQTLNLYAWTLLTANPPAQRDAEKALPLAERAVQMAEQLADQMSAVTQAAIRDTLAMAYHLTGDHARAMATIDTALHLLPEAATEQDVVKMRQTLTDHLATFRAALQPARK